jgi:hypothetical protein
MEVRTIFAQLRSPNSLRVAPIRTKLQIMYPKGLRKTTKKQSVAPTAITRWRSPPLGKGSVLSSWGSFNLSDRIKRGELKATRAMPTRKGKSPAPGRAADPIGSSRLPARYTPPRTRKQKETIGRARIINVTFP